MLSEPELVKARACAAVEGCDPRVLKSGCGAAEAMMTAFFSLRVFRRNNKIRPWKERPECNVRKW